MLCVSGLLVSDKNSAKACYRKGVEHTEIVSAFYLFILVPCKKEINNSDGLLIYRIRWT